MNAAGQRRLTPWLVALAAVLGAAWLLLVSGVGRRPHWAAPSSAVAPPPRGNTTPLPPPTPLDRFALVWQQPLFNPERKPVVQSTDNGSLGDLELTGVVLTPVLHMALLRDRQSHQELRLRSGEALPNGNFTLVEVRPRSAIFDTPGGRVELTLPAGAPIDERPTDGIANTNAPADAQMSPIAPPPAPELAPAPAPESSAQAQRIRELRATIQKRRAAQAAAAHEGEH